MTEPGSSSSGSPRRRRRRRRSSGARSGGGEGQAPEQAEGGQASSGGGRRDGGGGDGPPAGDRPRRKRRRRRGGSGEGAPGAESEAAAADDAPASGEGDADDAPARPVRKGPRPSVAVDEDLAVPVDQCAFAEFELKEQLVAGIAASGYRTPSEIQARTLPYALEGRDIIGQARTGTGKTAAFLVPSLQRMSDKPGPRVLVVVPTRELAMQVHEEARKLGRFLGIRALAIYGGDPMKRQLDELARGVSVIAATPGRLLDHLGRGTLKLDELDSLVLDEADRMFDLGFRDDIAKIMRWAPQRAQTMLFSATLSDEVLGLSERYMTDPAQVFLAPDKMTVDEVDQCTVAVDQPFKTDLLAAVLRKERPDRSIIFTRTKIGADRLAVRLKKRGLEARELHSGLHQKKRERILADFREGVFRYLIATDVAARGIDIDDVSHVINYDIPENAEDYVHRIGRTGRMGKTGRAVTFVTSDDGPFLTAIEKLINREVPATRFEGVRTLEDKPVEDKPEPKGPEYTRTLHGYIRKRRR